MNIFGYSLEQLFLFFILYSFLGWIMETIYCSIPAKRLVPRGFLYGPLCPIYGVGVVLMILFFTPLKQHIILFFLVAMLVMTAWEYFVAWVLETTTHVKYWDYSRFRFNIKGRVCLWMALVWGVLSYLVIFWIHPPVEELYEFLPQWLERPLAISLAVILLADAAFTIRSLALVSKLVKGITTAHEELQLQLTLGKAELDEHAAQLRQRYEDSVAQLEKHTRRFRSRYARLHFNPKYQIKLEDLHAAALLAKEELLRKREAKRKPKK